ncbi:bis-aminopropyl spermidine synthase family protein [Bacillus sonorensis]|uniref:bis-aminopropyl spermidine synthase family protein n=1 Tax=Bacillus sonorensis TaxID=119858 RepID=UPI00077CC2C9|nr:bis-aminopropyl spermidine synthase family protein [Bacillus sonorensis]MEC1355881.1 bis-aminopropyl spermidine synthase family protein [Bacillus sonorensis]
MLIGCGLIDILNKCYEDFLKIDLETEIGHLLKHKQAEKIVGIWNLWSRISFPRFETYVWQCVNRANRLQEVIDITGTVHTAINLLYVLSHHGLCQVSQNGDIVFSKKLKNDEVAVDCANAVIPERIKNKREHGQFQATWSTSVKRANMIFEQIPPWKHIFFCGDDDLTSLALGQMSSSACNISVGDIDRDLISFIKDYSGRHGLQIEAFEFDVKYEAPDQYKKKYDVFHCDPLDHGQGIDLWLQRAQEVLKGEPGDAIYLNISADRLGQREHYLFKHLHEMGFDLEEKYKNFSSYQVAEEPFLNTEKLNEEMNKINIGYDTIKDLYIHTDLYVFIRKSVRPIFLPQEFMEIRRKI